MLCYFSYCARTSLLAQNSSSVSVDVGVDCAAWLNSFRLFSQILLYTRREGRGRGRNANGDVDDAANALTRFACVRWPQSFYSRPELNIVIKFMLLCYRYIYKIYTNGRVLFANLSIRSALPRLASPRLD